MSPSAIEPTQANGQANGQVNGHEKSQRKTMDQYRSTTLFQPHRARQAIRDAHEGKIKPLCGFYFGLSAVPLVRVVAPMGFDLAWIDWEHSSCNVETMTTMVHETMFMSEGKTMPFVRIPGHDHAAVGYALDAGASIIVPQVDTVEQAKHIVSAAKYGAKNGGTRSGPPFRLYRGMTDKPLDPTRTLEDNLNDQAAIVIQIESLQGIDNLDDILTACPEIDACWLGTIDCRLSMGLPGNSGLGGAEPEWLAAVAKYETVMKKHDKPQAGFALGKMKERMSKGKAFTIVATDIMGLLSQVGELTQARELFPALQRPVVEAE